MRLILCIVLNTALAASVQADTIYKCVQADGMVAFSSLPCAGKARETRQLAVPAPEADDVSAARLAKERARLAAAERQFRQRQQSRDAGGGWSGGGGIAIANTSNLRTSKAAAPPSKQESDRKEAARLNAARIGNCSMPRKEANCL